LLRLAFVLGTTRGEDGLGLEGFDLSHEGVKRVVGLFIVLFTPYIALHPVSCTLTTNT